MTAPADSTTQFLQSTDSPDQYPLNLVRTDVYSHGLDSYNARLQDGKYFQQKERSLYLWDLVDQDAKEFRPSPKLDTLEDLGKYTGVEEKDPWWRFIFLQSPSARSGLSCSREQLQLLLTHHQVMPSFLDFIFTFKMRADPIQHTMFRHENYLDQDSPPFNLPTLGRSSHLIQHCFNVLSIERSTTDPEDKNSWQLRQTAICHTFDVQNGRALWIALKGNKLMRQRIPRAVRKHRDLQPAAMNSPERSFLASLHIHLVILEWGAENWSEYIDHLEETISDKSIVAKVTPVAAHVAQSLSRRVTMATIVSDNGRFDDNASQDEENPGILPRLVSRRTFARSMSSMLPTRPSFRVPKSRILPENETAQDETKDDQDNVSNVLDRNFSFDKLQTLDLLLDRLNQAVGAIEQNKEVIGDIREQYETVIDSYAFKTYMKSTAGSSGVPNFLRRLRGIEKELDLHHSRLNALVRAVQNDKSMFDAVLQYSSAKTSEHFAHSAKVSSDRMEDWTIKMHKIAEKTERETVSMHVITIFTLIFLPGTFLAVRAIPYLLHHLSTAALTVRQTFFSSGVLHWDEDGTLGSDWVIRTEALKLFLFICFPMMVVILAGWLGLYLIMRRKRRQDRDAARAGLGRYSDEKGVTSLTFISPDQGGEARLQ